MAESFVNSYKTELIADRVWRSRAQIELAPVEYVSRFNHDRLHETLGDKRSTPARSRRVRSSLLDGLPTFPSSIELNYIKTAEPP